jgi:hypothetical protein
VHEEDAKEWRRVGKGLFEWPILWSAGAGFDFNPVIDLFDGRWPRGAVDALNLDDSSMTSESPCQPFLYFMSDYGRQELSNMKALEGQPRGTDVLKLEWPTGTTPRYASLCVDKLIPLTLWDEAEVREIRSQYTQFHPGVATSAVADDTWHMCLMEVSVLPHDHREALHLRVMYAFLENLLVWEQVFRKYNVRVNVFNALRVDDQAGSWDYSHNPKHSHLWKSMRESPGDLRPRIWIADDCQVLRQYWEEIRRHDNGFRGVPHYFWTDWRRYEVPAGSAALPVNPQKALAISSMSGEKYYLSGARCESCGAIGSFAVNRQSLRSDPIPVDRLDVKCKSCGEAYSLYFDVSSFYGTHEE